MTDVTPELVTPEVVKPDPGAFGPGTFAPATESPVLSLKDRLRQSSASQEVKQELQGIKRGPGRPRKTERVPKEEGKDTKDTLAELQADRKRKKQRADQIAEEITGEFNDAILRFIIAQGCPPALLYNKGHVPVSVGKADEKYAPLGRKIAIDDFTAGMVGSFVAEFESSEAGAKLVGATTGGPVGLVVKGLIAGACVVGYLNGVREVVKQLQPVAAAYKEYQKNQQQNNQQPRGTDNGLN